MEHVKVRHTVQALSLCVYTCQTKNSKSINIKIKVAPNPYTSYIEHGSSNLVRKVMTKLQEASTLMV